MIDGLIVTPLKKIEHPKGDLMHAMKASSPGFSGFGEAYFSSVIEGEIKGWKQHTRMMLNLVVPVGKVRFVVYDDRQESGTFGQFSDITLGADNYARLTVPSGVWMAFQGASEGLNLLLNMADIEHNPDEANNKPLAQLSYPW